MGSGFKKFYFSNDALSLQKSFLTQLKSKNSSDLAPIHVLIPNYYVAAHLRHLFAKENPLLNVRFVTIRDLAKQLICKNEEFLKKIKLTQEMEIFQIGKIAQNVLRGTEHELVSNKRGFHQNLKNLFHHLIGQGAIKIPPINNKMKFFDQIFQTYMGLKKNFYNDPWLIEAAIDTVSADISCLYIFGLTKFSPLEMRWINQLATCSTIYLWMERSFFEDLQEPIFTWAGETFEESIDCTLIPNGVSEAATVTVQPVSHMQVESSWIAQTILVEMRRRLEALSNTSKASRAPGQDGLHRIGIFLNDFRNQKTYVEHALRQYGIPYVVYSGHPLISTRIGQAIRQLLELLFQNWKRDSWVLFLQSFPFKKSITDNMATPDRWNQWTIEAQITDKNTFFIKRLETCLKTPGTSMHADSRAKAWIEWQKDLISSLERVEREFSRNPAMFFQKMFEWIQIHADEQSIFDEHAVFFDDMIYFSQILEGATQWSDVKSIIVDKLAQPFVQDKVFESDGVFIAPIGMMPGLSFDIIFLPHTNEGCFPKSNPQSFDVTAQEMFRITQNSGVTFPLAENDFNIQKILFETSVFRTNQILISYAQFSLPGQEELRPSVFLQGLPKEKMFTSNVEPPPSTSHNPAFTQSIRTYIDSFQSNTWSAYNALISNPSKKRAYSAHDIKTYLSCPRQYFLSQVLRMDIEEFPENQFQVNPLDKGNLVHEILFKIFTKLKLENLFPLEPKNEEKIISVAKSVANDCFDRFILGHAYGSEELWKIDRDELLLDVTQYMKHEIKEGKFWIPYALEYRFGMDSRGEDEDERSNEKTVSLSVLGRDLAFRGKVDRIDLSPDKKQMRIIDYKTGAFKFKNWNYEKGTNLQIPLYMLLSKNFFPDIKPERVEGSLVHVKSFSKFDRRTLPHESLSSAEEKILELLDLTDTGINQGKFYPNPGFGKSNCRLCNFQTFCGDNIDRDIESIPVDEFMDTYKQRKDALK